MTELHFCNTFLKNIKGQDFEDIIRNKIFESKGQFSLNHSSRRLSNFGGNIWALRRDQPESITIIEGQNVKIENKIINVFFVREIFAKNNFDYKYVKNIYPSLKSGEWIRNNPLPEEDKDNFIEEYRIKYLKVKIDLDYPPQELTSWFNDFKIEPKNKIFETENWVKYALNNSIAEGMIDNRVDSFRIALKNIVEGKVEGEILKNAKGISILKFTNNEIGILYSKIELNSEETVYLLFNGAILSKQNPHWEKALITIQSNKIDFIKSKDSISRRAYRAYPEWTFRSFDDWYPIQKSKEFSNLSLTNEQIHFFDNFKFPYYINGQAGSGKSTMLYYIFANTFYYKCQDEIKGDIIFLTENESLLKHSKDAVFDLLTNNSEFKVPIELANQCSNNHFNSFKKFLFEMLPEGDKYCFKDSKYLNFSKFKQLYENSNLPKHIIDRYSAEESWFTIITYVYGYNLNNKICSKNYIATIPKKSQIISIKKFIGIEKHVLPFYEKLIHEEEYWDKLKIIRHINENVLIKKKYSVIVCDEAQDFCRVELRFILRLSKYLEYDLSKTDQVPIVFAGDPNQTVNPTGFRQGEMTSMLYEELQEIAKFNNQIQNYNPSFNYRSAQPVVSLANFVQYHRMKNLGIIQVKPQEAKRPNIDNDKTFNVFLNYNSIETNLELKIDLIKKLKHKIFIIPVNSQEKEEYIKKHNLLSLIDDVEVKTSVEAKGAEYEQVVLFGFGEYFAEKLINISKNKSDIEELFKRGFFFNKLYVGLTRAQTELLIIDSEHSKELFWKELVNNVNITTTKWGVLNEYKSDTILYNPGTIKDKISASSEENAIKNAEQDKKQGLYDSNPARLKVAAKQFIKIGKKEEGYECLALAEEINENWQSAANFYLNPIFKLPKYEKAAICLFRGRFFNELISRIGNNYKSISQDIRIIISRLINGEKIMKQDIDLLSKNKKLLIEIIENLEWRGELVNQFILSARTVQISEQKKEFVKILEEIANSNDLNLWKEIGNIRFDLKHYKEAIDAWNEIGFFENNEKYYISQVEYSKQNNNLEKTVLWLNELIKFRTPKERKNIYNEIIKIYNKYNFDDNSPDYYLIAFKAFAIQKPSSTDITKLGQIIETQFIHENSKLIKFYRKILEEDVLNNRIAVFILERWAKSIWKLKKENISLEKLNDKYLWFSKKHNIIYKEFELEELQNISESPKELKWKPNEQFKNLTIHNFRKFKELTLSNIGKYNLIVGDNNVGKTSLLEALLFTPNKEKYIENLAFAHINRKDIVRISINSEEKYIISPNFVIKEFVKKGAQPNEMKFDLYDQRNSWNYVIRKGSIDEVKEKFGNLTNIDIDEYISIVSDKLDIEIVELPLIIKKINPIDCIKSPLIPFGKGFGNDLALVFYEEIWKKLKNRKEFIESMKAFIPNIIDINANTEKKEIDIAERDAEEYAPLHQYGEGANKLFRILVQITLQKGKRLLIDEIDAGIHFSHFATFWKIIIEVAQKNNVQIFATTHNLECVKYFSEILKEDRYVSFQNDSRIITLRELPDKNIKAYTRSFEEFEYELNNEFEIRGGDL